MNAVPVLVPEESPLLAHAGHQPGENHVPGQRRAQQQDGIASRTRHRRDARSTPSGAGVPWRVFVQLCIITLLFDFVQYAVYAPLTAVFEDIICDRYYASLGSGSGSGSDAVLVVLVPPHRRDCKVVPVQSELAIVKGYKDGLNQIPSIVLGIPLGKLADRVGRKPVILLFLLGIFLSDSWVKILPLRLVWFAPVLKAVGGGANFGTSLFYTAVADIMGEIDRVDAFLKLSAMEMIVLVAGAPLVSALMSISQWYCLGLSSLLLVVAGLVALTLPETHPQHQKAMHGPPSPEPAPEQEQALLISGGCQHEDTEQPPAGPHAATTMAMLKNPGIVLYLCIFLLVAWGAHTWALLLQYVAQRFGWEFST
ncbi:hypothetical protein E4U41_005003, partial [Claviceps citrina]